MNEQDQKSILIIDDDKTIRKIINHHLLKNGYKVFEAVNAEEGFSVLKEEKIDLVLCDVTMDQMDGFAFCRKVREDKNYRTLPFIFVTAKNSLEDKSEALEAGGDDIITKPFDVKDLLLKVKALLRRTEIYKIYGAKKNLQNTFSNKIPKILLVDDDPVVCKLFQHNFDNAGFNCKTALSGEEGFNLAKNFHPDLIVSDILMPGVDGIQFRKNLIQDNELKNIPFIFLTSKEEEKDILEAYELGINDYVSKANGPKVLTAKINAIIKSIFNERQKLVSEIHNAVNTIGIKVIPEEAPKFDGYEISQWHQSYQGIPGGDFIDYLNLDSENLLIVLGDVMGKKWGAWFFAVAYAGYIRSAIRAAIKVSNDFSPSKIIQEVNKSVYEDSKISEVFATLSMVVINKKNKEIKYCGAGDLPLILRKNSTGEICKISSAGTLLGFSSNGNYEDTLIDFKANDVIFIITDGIIESRNSEGKQFGSKKFQEVLKELMPEENLIEKIKCEFKDFTSNNFEDDISIISIRKK